MAAGAVAVGSFILAEEACLSNLVGDCTPLSNPLGIEGLVEFEFLFLVMMLTAPPAVASLIVRWRRSHGDEREQLKWVLLAAILLGLAVVLSTGILPIPQFVIDLVFGIALSSIFIAIAVAILRYRLYDIDRIISRTVTYTLVVGVLGAVFFGLAALLADFVPSDDPLVVAIATLAAAALFNPLRQRFQRAVDHRFNRARFDAERVVEEFAGTLQDEVDPSDVKEGWVEVVSETMQPESLGIWVKGR